MIWHIVSFVGALILFLGGVAGALLVVVEDAPEGFAAVSAFFSLVGAGWLWIDFIAPLLSHRVKD